MPSIIKIAIVPFLSFLFAALAGCSGGVNVDVKGTPYTGNGILSWGTPTMYSDGTQLSTENIKGYRVYGRTPSGTYNPEIHYFVSAPTTSVYVKNFNLPVGQYYFVVTSLDTSDMESGFSDEIFAELK